MRWVFAFWGALMAAIAIAGAVFFGFSDAVEGALFGGTVAAMAILTAVVWRVRADEEYVRAHPDISMPVPWLAIAIALLAYGFEVGWWLSLIAGGMLVAGVIALVRERRAEHEAVRRR